MTRANINFTYRVDGIQKVLYYYQNGDQYPTGIRDGYHVLDLLKDFTPDGFKKWLGKNYRETRQVEFSNKDTGVSIISNYSPTDIPAKPELKDFTIIGDLTDYSYVFNDNPYGEDTIQVYNWEDQIFNGTKEKFATWIKKQK